MKLFVLINVLFFSVIIGKEMDKSNQKVLFDFSFDSSEASWDIINDSVMGGVSQSSFEILPDSVARFSGIVSLENNGGFASSRSYLEDSDLSGYSGMVIRVKGDGHIYSFRLRMDSNFDGTAYQAKFKTEENQWLEIKLLFDEFEPTFRGRTLKDVGKIKPERIKQIGILIADKQAGKFELFVDWIKAFR